MNLSRTVRHSLLLRLLSQTAKSQKSRKKPKALSLSLRGKIDTPLPNTINAMHQPALLTEDDFFNKLFSKNKVFENLRFEDGINIEEIEAYGASFKGIRARGANCQGSSFGPTSFVNADLQGANFEGSSFDTDSDFSNSNLESSNFANTNIFETGFDNASLKDVNMQNSLLNATHSINAHLQGANFNNSQFLYHNFQASGLAGSSFNSTIHVGSNFSNVNLTDASFKNAILIDVDFTNANLNGVDFNGAYFCGQPKGIENPRGLGIRPLEEKNDGYVDFNSIFYSPIVIDKLVANRALHTLDLPVDTMARIVSDGGNKHDFLADCDFNSYPIFMQVLRSEDWNSYRSSEAILRLADIWSNRIENLNSEVMSHLESNLHPTLFQSFTERLGNNVFLQPTEKEDDLTGSHFSHINFEGMDLSNSTLNSSRFYNCNLTDVNFNRCTYSDGESDMGPSFLNSLLLRSDFLDPTTENAFFYFENSYLLETRLPPDSRLHGVNVYYYKFPNDFEICEEFDYNGFLPPLNIATAVDASIPMPSNFDARFIDYILEEGISKKFVSGEDGAIPMPSNSDASFIEHIVNKGISDRFAIGGFVPMPSNFDASFIDYIFEEGISQKFAINSLNDLAPQGRASDTETKNYNFKYPATFKLLLDALKDPNTKTIDVSSSVISSHYYKVASKLFPGKLVGTPTFVGNSDENSAIDERLNYMNRMPENEE